jgi:hypothetical protein
MLLAAGIALSTRASAAPPRLPETPQQMLAAQRKAALDIIHAAIWEGASERLGGRSLAAPHRARHAAVRQRGAGALPRPAVNDVAPAKPARVQQVLGVPPNARCNDPSGDAAAAVQSELGVAGIGNLLVASWNDGQGIYTASDIQGIGWSSDGGATWHDAGSLVHPAGYPAFRWIGDPVVAANEKSGDFYIAGLARPDGTHNSIAVAHGRFTAGVFAMDSAWIVRKGLNSTTFLDKEWIACDSTTGNVYVTNTTFGLNGDSIDFYRSTDGARSWSSPVQLSSNSDAGWVQGSRVAVAANGDVETAWYAADQVTVENDLRFRRSSNHGTSFLAQVTPVTFNEQFGTGAPAFNRDWGPNFPGLAVDRSGGPHTGRVYLTWAECWRFLAAPIPMGTAHFENPEYNGNAANATPCTIGETLRGELDTNTYGALDQDWWAFPLTAGQSIIVYADSVSVPSGWFLRLIAPDGTQRLCRGGQSDSTQNTDPTSPATAYYTFTAPAAGTYYLEMHAQSYAPITYAIRTAFGTPGAERGRDQRDGFVSWSDNGTTWSTPARLNDDGIGYDLVYPEIGVGSDGCAYVTWFDHRDDTYGSRANVYGTRTADGGATWSANQLLSSAQSNFTTSAASLAPDLGDYNGVANTGSLFIAAWGDGRDTASPDAWAAPLDLSSALSSCQPDTTIAAGTSEAATWTLENHDAAFPGNYTVTLASARNWPMPAPVLVTVSGGSSAPCNATIAVPDSAGNGPNTICATMTAPGGVVTATCCFALTVTNSQLAVAPGALAFALAPSRPNPAADGAQIAWSLPAAGRARLAIYDLAGARVRTLVDGPLPAGPGALRWDGRDEHGAAVRPGAYWYRLEFDGHVLARRLVLAR